MLNTIYAIQAKLTAEGTSIDNILALVIGLFVLFGTGYFVELHKREKLEKENNQ